MPVKSNLGDPETSKFSTKPDSLKKIWASPGPETDARLDLPAERSADKPHKDPKQQPPSRLPPAKTSPAKAPLPEEKRHLHHPLPADWPERAMQPVDLQVHRLCQRVVDRHGAGSIEAEQAWEARAHCRDHMVERYRPDIGFVRLASPKRGRSEEERIDDIPRYVAALVRHKLEEARKRGQRLSLGLDGAEVVDERPRRVDSWIELREVEERVEDQLSQMRISPDLRTAVRTVLRGESSVVKEARRCGVSRDVLQRRVGEVRGRVREGFGLGPRRRKKRS